MESYSNQTGINKCMIIRPIKYLLVCVTCGILFPLIALFLVLNTIELLIDDYVSVRENDDRLKLVFRKSFTKVLKGSR